MARRRYNRVVLLAVLLAAVTLSPPTTGAQGGGLDAAAEPDRGIVYLSENFVPTSHPQWIITGTNVDVSRFSAVTGSPDCRGWTRQKPDVTLIWSGQVDTLRILFVPQARPGDGGRADTTLVVQKPDGTWVCNDNAAADKTEPLLALNAPAAGRYAIWVANKERISDLGVLIITRDSVSPALDLLAAYLSSYHTAGPLDPALSPRHGALHLSPGLVPLGDPIIIKTVSGGIYGDLFTTLNIPEDCFLNGWADRRSTLRFTWTQGENNFLRVFFVASGASHNDQTLVIQKPDGKLICHKGTASVGPQIDLDNAAGEYSIWLANDSRQESGGSVSAVPRVGQLFITQDRGRTSAKPEGDVAQAADGAAQVGVGAAQVAGGEAEARGSRVETTLAPNEATTTMTLTPHAGTVQPAVQTVEQAAGTPFTFNLSVSSPADQNHVIRLVFKTPATLPSDTLMLLFNELMLTLDVSDFWFSLSGPQGDEWVMMFRLNPVDYSPNTAVKLDLSIPITVPAPAPGQESLPLIIELHSYASEEGAEPTTVLRQEYHFQPPP